MAVSREPMCRRCGYIICRGAAAICPECGGDLRAVGVVSAKHMRPNYPLGIVVAVGMILAPLALYFGGWAAEQLPPWGTAYWAHATVETGIPAALPGGSDAVVDIYAKGWRGFAHHRPEAVAVTWWAEQSGRMTSRVKAELLPSGSWVISTAPWQRAEARFARFDSAAVRRFLERAQVDPDSDPGKIAGERVLAEVNNFMNAKLPFGREFHHPLDQATQPSVEYELRSAPRTSAVAGAIWLAAIGWFARRVYVHHRRRLANALAEEQRTLDELNVPSSRP